ncbi:hypothetical protein AAIB33_02160 [Microbacterium sp. AZCO]|uniref:hypothetical protein n=1 Tax=Microbacterium sp. AZCO TaxID=3142976 RepID=UPI0031F41D90
MIDSDLAARAEAVRSAQAEQKAREMLTARLHRESVLERALTIPCPAGHAPAGEYCTNPAGLRACCGRRVAAAKLLPHPEPDPEPASPPRRRRYAGAGHTS